MLSRLSASFHVAVIINLSAVGGKRTAFALRVLKKKETLMLSPDEIIPWAVEEPGLKRMSNTPKPVILMTMYDPQMAGVNSHIIFNAFVQSALLLSQSSGCCMGKWEYSLHVVA